jgi:hypothetical protein
MLINSDIDVQQCQEELQESQIRSKEKSRYISGGLRSTGVTDMDDDG